MRPPLKSFAVQPKPSRAYVLPTIFGCYKLNRSSFGYDNRIQTESKWIRAMPAFRGHVRWVGLKREYWRYDGIFSEFLRKPRLFLRRFRADKEGGVSLSEYFGHVAFLALALSFSFQDILSLRLCSLLSGISMAFFNYYHPHGKPLFLPFRWNLIFIFINAYMIVLILWNRWKSKRLDPFEEKMFEQNFAVTGMDLMDFRTLCLAGELTKAKKGDYLTKQGTRCLYVRVIISGHAAFTIDDNQPCSAAGPGNFVSELGLHAGIRFAHQVSTASTVVSSDELVCYSWRRGALIDVLESNQRIAAAFQNAISGDLVRKLTSDMPECQLMGRRDFKMVLKMVVEQEKPSRHRVNMVDRYRKIHNISDKELAKTLQELGWTVKRFYAGCGIDEQLHIKETAPPVTQRDFIIN